MPVESTHRTCVIVILMHRSLSGGMVSALHRLCVLDVSCNPQLTQEVDGGGGGGGGFRVLTSSLCHAASLTTLRLQACGLTADSLEALSKKSSVFCQ